MLLVLQGQPLMHQYQDVVIALNPPYTPISVCQLKKFLLFEIIKMQ
jgi:hypothetical protein